MSNCLIFALLLVLLCGSSTGYQDDSTRDFMVAELIHRDSSLSPFYNSSKSAAERMREAVTRSLSRIVTSNSSQHFNEKGIMSPMIPGEDDYFMKIKPDMSQELLLMASTRSWFTWIDCQDQNGIPYLKPKKDGDSYEEILRHSDECRDLADIKAGPSLVANPTPTCHYEYSYLRKVTRGVISRAKFQFDSTETKGFNSGTKRSVLLFGCCTQRIKSRFDSRIQGMAGLGYGQLSLPSQLATRNRWIDEQFSYCLLPLGSKNPTKLVFGKNKKFQDERDSKIPFKTNINFPYYYLTLKYVRVQSEKTRELQETYNNMIIDSGTTVTSLDPSLFEEVRSFVKNSLSSLRPVEELDETNPFKLCYNIHDTQSVLFPNIELHFKGHEGEKTSIVLKYENIFVKYNENENQEMICMNIVPAAEGEVSVLGNVAQVGFHVEFNLKQKMIYFTPTDCTELEI